MLNFKATLRIISSDSSLEELSKVLGSPSKGFSKGDTYSKGKRKREFTLWAYESSLAEEKSLELHLKFLLEHIESKKESFHKLDKVKKDIFCMFSSDNGQGGATLPAYLMKQLSKYDIDLIMDVYAESE